MGGGISSAKHLYQYQRIGVRRQYRPARAMAATDNRRGRSNPIDYKEFAKTGRKTQLNSIEEEYSQDSSTIRGSQANQGGSRQVPVQVTPYPATPSTSAARDPRRKLSLMETMKRAVGLHVPDLSNSEEIEVVVERGVSQNQGEVLEIHAPDEALGESEEDDLNLLESGLETL